VLGPIELTDHQLASPLGRTSPLVKVGLAIVWLVGLAFSQAIGPPLALAAVAIGAALVFGAVEPTRLLRAIAPLVGAAIGIVVFNALFSASNTDPASPLAFAVGSWRVTETAVSAAFGLGARVVAVVAVGAAFALTTEPTRLVDSLVQQARLSARFAYGALAAYQAVPRLGDDLATLRSARRIRGLRGSWSPRTLVGLLVRAIRGADQLAVAMDARGFGSDGRSHYREVHWRPLDGLVAGSGLVVLVAALVFVR
jgi:energy-coupling factor transport system permease protein